MPAAHLVLALWAGVRASSGFPGDLTSREHLEENLAMNHISRGTDDSMQCSGFIEYQKQARAAAAAADAVG